MKNVAAVLTSALALAALQGYAVPTDRPPAVKRSDTYNSLYNGESTQVNGTTQGNTTTQTYGNNGYSGIENDGYGRGPTQTNGHRKRPKKTTVKTAIKAWRPPGGLMFVDVNKMKHTKAYVANGLTAVLATGKTVLSGQTTATKVGDFQLYYENEMIEGVALLDKDGQPSELLDILDCQLEGKVAKCVLTDYDGTTIAAVKTTTITGMTKKIKATKYLKPPAYVRNTIVSYQIAAVTSTGVDSSLGAATTNVTQPTARA